MATAACPMCRAPHAHLGSARPLAALRAAPARLAPAEWAVCEVLGHLADAEIALAFRIRKVAAEPGQVLVAWDQDRWAEGGRYRRTPLREARATFTALRRSTLASVARLSAAQRGQHGRHPEYGRLTMGQMLAHWADHDLKPLAQIAAAQSR